MISYKTTATNQGKQNTIRATHHVLCAAYNTIYLGMNLFYVVSSIFRVISVGWYVLFIEIEKELTKAFLTNTRILISDMLNKHCSGALV